MWQGTKAKRLYYLPSDAVSENCSFVENKMKTSLNSLTFGFIIAIINDCRDTNAKARQESRFQAQLLKAGILALPRFIGVEHGLEASLNLIDQIDAIGENPGGIAANVANRSGDERENGNGTKFCCFQYEKIWNLSTIGGATLSLVKKLRLTESVFVIHLGDAVRRMVRDGFIPKSVAEEIADSQFRSFDFVPRAMAYVLSGKQLCCTEMPVASGIPDSKPVIACIDCFGNGKTTVLASELKVESGHVQTAFGRLPFFRRLADAPDGIVAIIQGSSGIPGRRFAEIVINGGRAVDRLGFKVGDRVL